MKEASEFGDVWTKAAARMPDDHMAWRIINKAFPARPGLLAADKEQRLAQVYTLARSGPNPLTQGLAAEALLEADIPEVTRELLLHPLSDVVAAAARHLAKPAAGEKGKTPGTAPEPAMRDTQAVPFLIYVLNRNNYLQPGDEEATVHMLLQRHLVNAILYITQAEKEVGAVKIGEEEYIDSVLASARKWAAEKGLQPLEKQHPPKTEPPIESKPAPAGAGASTGAVVPKAEAVPRDFGNRRPFIPMKPAEELNRNWQDAAARLPDNAPIWREIQRHLKTSTAAVPTSKDMQLSALYELVCHNERPNWQVVGARLLLKADIPEVLHELLLHPHPGIVNAACDHLLQQAAKPVGGDKAEPKTESPRDLAAVPFIILVLQRNNYDQMGSEEATTNLIIKQKTVAILMKFMGKEEELSQVNVDRLGDVDRVLALARAWAAENGFQPLEKQRPTKAFPPTEPKPAAARQ
jgi:hypothetical protein